MTAKPIEIFIDADACPVKDEIYKVAQRYGLKTWVVSNAFIMIPRSAMIERVIVDAGPDVADDWIAEHVAPGDVALFSVSVTSFSLTPQTSVNFTDTLPSGMVYVDATTGGIAPVISGIKGGIIMRSMPMPAPMATHSAAAVQ